MHLDVRERAQTGNQLLDMNPGTAVDVRRPLPGEHGDVHNDEA
jgi:hypothetical protein